MAAPHRSQMRALVAVTVASVLLVAGCTADEREPEPPAASSSPRPTATAVPLPEDGACYRLTFQDALAPSTRADEVPCADEHTSMTYAVGTLDRVVDGHLLAVDSDRVLDRLAERCPDRLADLVGGTLEQARLSMLRPVWFTPTLTEADAGADWFRCDVIAVAGQERLAPLPRRLAGALDTAEGRRTWGMCGTDEPDSESFERVLCSETHAWRAVAVVAFEPGDYPGEDVVRDRGQTPCEDAGRSVADDALNFRWGYEWPTEEQWASGQTYGRCWAPD